MKKSELEDMVVKLTAMVAKLEAEKKAIQENYVLIPMKYKDHIKINYEDHS